MPRRVAAALLVAMTLGCAPSVHQRRDAIDVAPAPSTFWIPPPSAPPGTRSSADLPPELRGRVWELGDVLDVALRLSPSTRVSWLNARAALERYGVERAAYLPRVTLDGALGTRAVYDSSDGEGDRQTSQGASANLSWLLLDFGSREGGLEAARQDLLAANWAHNRAVQDLVFRVQQAYYAYQAAQALLDARRVSLRGAEVNLEAAHQRHAAGVATIADVLQARTAVAQARLALLTVEGDIRSAQGALAASMGLAADTDLEVAAPREVPMRSVAARVDELILEALARRPDLGATRSQALASEAGLRRVRGDGRPTLTLASSGGTTWYDGSGSANGSSGDRREDAWAASLVLRYPLFTGLAQTHGERAARLEAQGARERVRTLEQTVILQVFTSYHALQTATERVSTAAELLASAEQSEAVALGRYREGVGSILDLLAAQSALAEGRAQAVQSRWEWHTALARLAHDAGLLGLDGEMAGGAAP